jgi:hypothetical protein
MTLTLDQKAQICIIQAYEWLFECNLQGEMPPKNTNYYYKARFRALHYLSKWNDLTLYHYVKENY